MRRSSWVWLAVVVVLPLPVLWGLTPWDRGPGVVQVLALRVPTLLVLAAVAVVALVVRRWWAAGVLVVACGVGAFPLATAGVAGALAADPDGPTLGIVSVNARYGLADAEQIVALVREQEADVLVVVELTPELVERLDDAGLADVLPHREVLPARGPEGSGLWSATPLRDGGEIPGSTMRMPFATLDVGRCTVRVLAAHPMPPIPGAEGTWRAELAALGLFLRSDDGVVDVAAGDLNAGLTLPTFRAMLGDSLTTARSAAGLAWAPTWPTDTLRPWVDLDHIVVPVGTGATAAGTHVVDGTDHLAVSARIAPVC